MCEVIKPRFKVYEPVMMVFGTETERIDGYIHAIQKVNSINSEGVYIYYLYAVKPVITGKLLLTSFFAEQFIHERWVKE